MERVGRSPRRDGSTRVGRPRRSVLWIGLIMMGCGGDRVTSEDGPVHLSASEVHVFGASDAVGLIRDLDVLPDGSVWALNSGEPFFVGFDSGGEVMGTHGGSGGGPEEFRMPAAFVTGGVDGEAWVFDFLRHAVIRVSRPGEWAQLPIPREAIPPGSLLGGMDIMSPTVRTARMGNELLLPRTTGSMASGLTSFRLAILGADLMALDLESGSVRVVVSLGEVLDDPSQGFVPTDGGFPLWYRLWAVCGEDRIRVYDRVRNQLRGFSRDGEELTPVSLPAAYPTEVSPREFAQVVFPLRQAEITGGVGSRLGAEDSARVLNEMIQGIRGQPRELAAYLPRYVDFRCAEDGAMWLQPVDLSIGGLDGGAKWMRIMPDGDVREVHFPERFDPMRFMSGRVWGIQRDEWDVPSVAWIALPPPLAM